MEGVRAGRRGAAKPAPPPDRGGAAAGGQCRQNKKKSRARASLATTSRLQYRSYLKCSGEACPRQAPQRPSLDHCTNFNGIARLRADVCGSTKKYQVSTAEAILGACSSLCALLRGLCRLLCRISNILTRLLHIRGSLLSQVT